MAYSTITKPSLYFNTKLYTGNATDNTAITGVGFQPDLCWFKARSQSYSHNLQDAVRGAGKRLEPDQSTVESTYTSFKSFDTDGFTLGTGAAVNGNGVTFVSWNWKANGAGSANTDGTISSTVSVNTTAGFSIVSFNGQTGTVGHGLGVKPSMIILKCRGTSNNWVIQHKGLTGGMDEKALIFTNSAEISAATAEPTTSVFTVNNQIAENDNNIAYVFAEKKGYSKFGSFVGNASTNGTFCYLGFKPAFVILKNASATGNWWMMDNKRNGYNVTGQRLMANSSSNEDSFSDVVDFTSNGFKLRGTYGDINGSGNTIIYMAFAEEPLVANVGQGVPATAR